MVWKKKATRKTKQPTAAKHSLNPAEFADHKMPLYKCNRLNTCLGPKDAGWQDWIEGQLGNRAVGTQSLRLDNEFYQTVGLVQTEHKLNVCIWSVQLRTGRASVVTLLAKRDSIFIGGGSHTHLNQSSMASTKSSGSNFLQLKTLLSIMMRVRVQRAEEDCQMCSSSSLRRQTETLPLGLCSACVLSSE